MNNPEVPAPFNNNEITVNNFSLQKQQTGSLPFITMNNVEKIDSYKQNVSDYEETYNKLTNELKEVVSNINNITKALGSKKINNIKGNQVNNIKQYLSNSFNQIKADINDFELNIDKLNGIIQTTNSNIEQVTILNKNIETFIASIETTFKPRTVKSKSSGSYKGVIEGELGDSTENLDNLIINYKNMQDKCNGLIIKSKQIFNKKVLGFKTNLKLKVIDYFNNEILGLKYETYMKLDTKYNTAPNNTEKLDTLVEMKELIGKIKKDVNEFGPILNSKYKYNNNPNNKKYNIYNINILNSQNINLFKEKINKMADKTQIDIDDAIADYKKVGTEKLKALQEQLQQILESIPPPIQAYNNTAGNKLSIQFNREQLKGISDSIQTRIKEILDLIDRTLANSDGSGTSIPHTIIKSNSDGEFLAAPAASMENNLFQKMNIASGTNKNELESIVDKQEMEPLSQQKDSNKSNTIVGLPVNWKINGNNKPLWTVNGKGSKGTGIGTVKGIKNNFYIIGDLSKVTNGGEEIPINGEINVSKNLINNRSLYNIHENNEINNTINPLQQKKQAQQPVVSTNSVNQKSNSKIEIGDTISWNHKEKNGSTGRRSGTVENIQKNKNNKITGYTVSGNSGGRSSIRLIDHNIKLNEKSNW